MNVALRPEPLNILSICTGGGGLDLGVELALPGARAVCMVEREAFAVAHLVSAMEQGLLAPAPVWSDARTFDGRPWRGVVDGLIGGIPCQPHSLAGKRLVDEDERDLWSTTRRIIVHARPWFVLIENVGGMLSSGGAQRVWRDLGRLGFEREIGLFTAEEVRASHERERLFIIGVADTESTDGWSELEEGGARRGRAGSSGDGDPALGDTSEPGLAFGLCRRRDAEQEHAPAERAGSVAVVDAASIGRREGRAEPSLRSGWDSAASAGVIDLFPPGPSDTSGWLRVLERAAHLEPAFRRVADGLASRMDIARVDRLRMLGNGVVPLEAAYAFRTLVSRLAGRSAVAARLVRMMETPCE